MYQTGVQVHNGHILNRKVPRPSYRHAAPAGFVFTVASWLQLANHCCRPWPYVDDLNEDQESEEVIDAEKPEPIGSCGHDNCNICKQWTSYPQSHFLNWTIKPVTKCGIAGAVRGQDHPCTIYRVDVMEDGVFRDDPGTFEVTSANKREFWSNVLQPKVSATRRVITDHLLMGPL